MLKQLSALISILCAASCLTAGTDSIGSVVAQGDLRIDGHPVQGSGTIFDGTIFETGSEPNSTADLRLNNGTKITLHSDSSGALYRDHFVLIRGAAETTAIGPFRVEVNGLVIQPSERRASEMVAILSGGAISVLAQTGQLQIAANRGQLVTQLGPQQMQAFTQNGNGGWRVGEPSWRYAGNGEHGGDGGGDSGDDWDHRHPHHHHSR
jgi:hypothetical protein